MNSVDPEKFEAVFAELRGDLEDNLTIEGFSTKEIAHFNRCLNVTVKGGKLQRGPAVVFTGSKISVQPLGDDQLRELSILGWLVEILQAPYLVWDDIMDDSTMRRGQLCWYRQPGVGMMAVNDGCLLKSAVFILLKKHFVNHPSYITFVELFLKAGLQTEIGQFGDVFTTQEDLESFSMDKYFFIIDRKSSFYSLYLPVALALEYLQRATPNNLQQARKLATALGEYFQVLDDYLDIYGDPKLTGKIGTDIQDNKCTWVINEAIRRCNQTQLLDLKATYGRKDPDSVSKVKSILEDIGMREAYKEFEKSQSEKIEQMIDAIDEREGLKKELYTVLFAGFKKGRVTSVT